MQACSSLSSTCLAVMRAGLAVSTEGSLAPRYRQCVLPAQPLPRVTAPPPAAASISQATVSCPKPCAEAPGCGPHNEIGPPPAAGESDCGRLLLSSAPSSPW